MPETRKVEADRRLLPCWGFSWLSSMRTREMQVPSWAITRIYLKCGSKPLHVHTCPNFWYSVQHSHWGRSYVICKWIIILNSRWTWHMGSRWYTSDTSLRKGDSHLKHNSLTSPRHVPYLLHIPARGLHVGRYPPQPVSVLWNSPTLWPSFPSARAIFEPKLFPYKYSQQFSNLVIPD